MSIPAHIAEGIQNALDDHAEFDAIDHPVTAGVIAKHHGGGFVYVLSVDDGVADFCLAHPYVENATDRDAIVFTDDTHLAYDLVVQGDVRGYAPVKYLTGKTPSIHLLTTRTGSGIPLKGRLDSRWDFKISEVLRLHQLMTYYKKDN